MVPSKVVKGSTVHSKHPKSEFYSLYRREILDCKDGWGLFGDPHAEAHAAGECVDADAGDID